MYWDREGFFKEPLQLDDEKFGLMYASGRFPCLRRISIMVSMRILPEDEDTLAVRLRSWLPFIDGTGMLVVKAGTYDDATQFMKDASIVSCT